MRVQSKDFRGFSLVELSIILVILGLLIGGILAGRSLVRASELRAVTSEFSRYLAATQSFRSKYLALPGDFSAATSFWGKDNNACSGDAGSSWTPGTCNGDGDGRIDAPLAASASGEIFRYWQHLTLAGFIEGSFSGIAGPASSRDALIGSNVPSSRLGDAGWSAEYFDNSGGGLAWPFLIDLGNSLIVGADPGSQLTRGSAFRPEEAWNVDSKLDDGLPARGRVVVDGPLALSDCTYAASASDLAAHYRLETRAEACSLRFIRLF